jgi:hypothetical protein
MKNPIYKLRKNTLQKKKKKQQNIDHKQSMHAVFSFKKVMTFIKKYRSK